jgi:uncharacterized membrane protein
MRLLRINVRRIFVTGILIVLPALITYFLLTFLFSKVNYYVTPYMKKALGVLPDSLAEILEPVLPVVALLFTLGLIFFVGLMGTNYLGKRIIDAFHSTMLQIPIVKGIYGSAKQLFDAFNLPGVRAFEEVCLIEYPRRGLYCLGFVTRQAEGEIQAITHERTDYVFLPTTPNPTSGYLIVVPRSEIHVLDLSIEEGLKLIVSGGMVYPKREREVRKQLTAAGVENPASLPSHEEEAGAPSGEKPS